VTFQTSDLLPEASKPGACWRLVLLRSWQHLKMKKCIFIVLF